MEQKEHLDRIVAKCRELLAVAEKRTPGMWEEDSCCVISRCTEEADEARSHVDGGFYRIEAEGDPDACAFIASCAGAAEAGWRATIASIEGIRSIGYADGHLASTIIAAWTEELL